VDRHRHAVGDADHATLATTPASNSAAEPAQLQRLVSDQTGLRHGAKPADVDSYNYDQPFAQYDGPVQHDRRLRILVLRSRPIPGAGYKAIDS